MELSGRTALVTGAGSGIGRAAAEALAARGIGLALLGRRVERLRETQSRIEAIGGESHAYPSDASDPDQMETVLSDVRRRIGEPSILINSAGVHGEFTPIHRSDPARWRETLLTNLYSPYLLCRLCAPAMITGGWGRIVNVSSASGLYDPNGMNSAYGLSKNALNFFTRQMAQELDGTGASCTAIHPGEVKTEMWAEIRDDAGSRGAEARGMSDWAAMVEATGGDPPEKAAELILRIIGSDPAEINGRFLWIEGGIQTPRPSW